MIDSDRRHEPGLTPRPEIRINALTGDRVIIAPNRAVRPNLPSQTSDSEQLPHYDPSCPFCPGNEKQSPAEVYRIPEGGGDWTVRVVANKYPALVEDLPGGSVEELGPYRYAEPALGRHEVIIEHPRHDITFVQYGDDDVLNTMKAYRDRFSAAAEYEKSRHIVIFRNQGKLANASIMHPHTHMAALSFVPTHVKRVLERSLEHRGAGGHALLFDIVQDEVDRGDRLITSTKRFAAFTPFAPMHDYEVWVAPRFVPPRFDRVDDETLAEFGLTLRQTLAALQNSLNGPDYNYVLHFPPLLGAESALPWYIQIIPRRTLAAGFELGVGVHILIATPEEAAARLREGLS